MLARGLEESGLGFFQLVHVVAVVAKEGTCGLHAAHACELQPEVDAVALALGLELDNLPPVVGGVAAYLRLALLLRLVLRTLRGFLAAIGLTVHVPACLSSVQAGRDEQCPHLYRYGHRRSVSQVRQRIED